VEVETPSPPPSFFYIKQNNIIILNRFILGANLNSWYKQTQNTPLNMAKKKKFGAIVAELKKRDGVTTPAYESWCHMN
jgi:hypothetical protein